MDKIATEKKSKVDGEMVYNPILQRWEGNESVLRDFDLININNLNTSSHNGKMIVCPNKRCNNSSIFSSDDEEDILARFDSEDEDEDGNGSVNDKCLNKKKKKEIDQKDSWIEPSQSNNTFNDDGNLIKIPSRINNDFEIGTEFDITPEFFEALLASERQHRNETTKWYPAAGALKNEQRFGLRSPTIEHGFLHEIRSTNRKSPKSANNNSKKSIEICKNTNNRKFGNISTIPNRKPFK